MPSFCEICGKRMSKPGRVHMVDGAKVILCESCYTRVTYSNRRLGKPRTHIPPPRKPGQRAGILPFSESVELVEGYGNRVRAAREKLGLSQQELAKKLNERVTLIKKIEQETFHPPDEMGRKIESFLRIKIFERSTPLDAQGFEQYLAKPSRKPSLEEAARRKKQQSE